MKIRRVRSLVGIVSIVCATAIAAVAQKRVEVKFDRGSNRADYFNNAVTGDGTVDYEAVVIRSVDSN